MVNITNQKTSNNSQLLQSISNQLRNLISETDTYTNEYRKQIADKLYGIIKDITIDPDRESGAQIKAKSELIRTFNEILRDIESSKRENIKVQQKQSELANESSKDDAIYLALLQTLTQQLPQQQLKKTENDTTSIDNIGITSQETIEKELEDIARKHNIEINDNELEKNPKKIDINIFLKDD